MPNNRKTHGADQYLTRANSKPLEVFEVNVRRIFLVAIFVFAQLLINFHHVTDAHNASDDDTVVECNICVVSSGVFDLPANVIASQRPLTRSGETPSFFSQRPLSGHARSSLPRAPPINI